MIQSILYLILAAFGLGFLVFIHELGHYFMARRVGMTVEAFGIGFGKPLFTWEHKGVKWNFCWLPFGGYVRIKGMEKKGGVEPHQIPDGFFGKKPVDRIKVALMGPLSNIVFAFVAFLLIWTTGGRQKPFSEFTHFIGWEDSCSKLHELGVLPGDEITAYDNRSFQGLKDMQYAMIMGDKTAKIKGYKINYANKEKTPFDYTLETYQHPFAIDKRINTIGILNLASFLIFERNATEGVNGPMQDSGIQPKDRIVWVDGQLVFSQPQLSALINESKTMLTVQRGEKTFQTRVPRLKVSDLRLTPMERAEIDDWQHETDLKAKVAELFFIPYNISYDATVENELTYLDESSQPCLFSKLGQSSLGTTLLPGDRILAVDGIRVSNAVELLKQMQTRNVRIIVKRDHQQVPLNWKSADAYFTSSIDWQSVNQIASSLGTEHSVTNAGPYYLLAPVVPKTYYELPLSEIQKTLLSNKENTQKKEIEEIEDPKAKKQAMQNFETEQKKLWLGIVLQDRMVNYNPSPLVLFGDVFHDTWLTLLSLFSGSLSPKWMAGPLGIVQVIQVSWYTGVKEALFWMGVISLNLAILNLLPIPVLDGGHICFSAIEWMTKKPISTKTMERLIIPFFVLFIALFIFLTYNDLIRIFGRFF